MEYRLIKPLGLLAGLNVGFHLSEFTKFGEDSWTETINSFISDDDLGFTAGTRIHLNKLHLTLRFNQGLKNINELTFTDVNGTPQESITFKTQHYQIGIGYTFGG